MSKALIIQGSSRSHGNTYYFGQYLQSLTNCDHLDLLGHHIGAFDYEFKNENDDFLPLIKKLISEYDTWILASPVYWYTMSGTMKIFFDRLSDLLYKHKDWGRKLRGKNLACLSVSDSDDIEESFYKAFSLSADYLGMKYIGQYHAWGDGADISTQVKNGLENFAQIIGGDRV